jgi:hypothetical protein
MTKYLRLPFFDELDEAKNILLVGAGGGYDIFSGLPLYFGLRFEGKQVYLANLSFSFLPPFKGQKDSPALLKVTADTPLLDDYFPERFLSEWFRQQGEEVPIYCFNSSGVKTLSEIYKALINHLSIDTVILVDGGTDSLMRGDEEGLGTPYEDIANIIAVNELNIERKILTCLGFGVDFFHGVCHAQFLEAVADLTKSGGYLGMFSLMQEMPEVQKFRAASEYVFKAMPNDISIVSSSILSALSGHYGNYHATNRTRGSQLWINPLMPVYWCFQLTHVAQRILYLEQMKETTTKMDVGRVIRKFRLQCKTIRAWENIPV